MNRVKRVVVLENKINYQTKELIINFQVHFLVDTDRILESKISRTDQTLMRADQFIYLMIFQT